MFAACAMLACESERADESQVETNISFGDERRHFSIVVLDVNLLVSSGILNFLGRGMPFAKRYIPQRSADGGRLVGRLASFTKYGTSRNQES